MSDSKARLRWLCRRGMKELDVLLSRYLEECYDSANETQQNAFRDLLELQDPTVFALLLGKEQSPDPGIDALIRQLRPD